MTRWTRKDFRRPAGQTDAHDGCAYRRMRMTRRQRVTARWSLRLAAHLDVRALGKARALTRPSQAASL